MTSDNRQPLVTIIMPVYNGMPYVIEAIDSILAQTYPAIEFIVIDDASTDDTLTQLQGYTDRLTLLSNAENLGIYGTMNHGLNMANGEFVAIYHADDIYEPTIVEQEVACLQRYPDVGAVFCADILVDRDNREYGRLQLPVEVAGGQPLDYATVINAELTYKNIFLVCPTCMVRKSVHDAVGNYNQAVYRNSADLEMYLRIARSYRIVILEQYLLRYRHGHGNSSQNYHHLRTEPQRFFMIMDNILQGGAAEVATPAALKHFEAHRHHEHVMCAISAYIKNDLVLCRTLTGRARFGRLLQSNRIQRLRMALLLLILRTVSVLPYSKTIASVFYRRWHDKSQAA